MAHNVTCPICTRKFDRDKEEYVQMSARRYAHAKCALREAEKNSTPVPEIINPLDNVVCEYCKKPMNRKDEDCVPLGNGKYAHRECQHIEDTRELTEQEKLDRYIMKLFKTDYVHQRVKRQINDFMKQYNYTYSGIRKSLTYWYEVKKQPIEKANGGIGIVPYIYKDAYNYYYMLWEAQQKNQNKDIESYKPEDIVIRVPAPQRNIKKRKLFTFLDEEENNG
jgi:hypothetical protein